MNGILSSQTAAGALQIYAPRTRSWATFAQATVPITAGLRINGGIRYTNDRKHGDISQDNDPRGRDPSDFAYTAHRNDHAVTWRGALEYDLGSQRLVYLSAETGFKAGGLTLAPQSPTYGDERITAYTLGSKNKFFDNRLLVNLEAFYWDYRHQQYSHLGALLLPTGAAFPAFLTDNVGDARPKGAEAEIQFRPFPDTLVGTQIQYLDAHYRNFSYRTPNLAPFPLRPNVGPICSTAYTPPAVRGSLGIQTVNCAGAPLPFSSKWTVTLSGQQTVHLGEAKRLGKVSGRYESGRYAGSEFLAAQYQRGVTTVDASLTYAFPGNRLSVTGYARNIGDKQILAQTFVPFTSSGYAAGTLRPPRTYGARLEFHY